MAQAQVIPKQQKKKTFSFQNFQVGLTIALAAQPFEVIRTSSIASFKQGNHNHLSGTISVVKQIYKMEGLRGYFRGGLITLGKSTLGAGVFFNGLENVHVLTEGLRDIKYIPTNAINFLNAAISRIFTTLAVSPTNVLKTKFEVVGSRQYTSIGNAIASIYKRDGLIGFYRGIVPTIIRDVPFAGLEYSIYRSLLDNYGKYLTKKEDPYDSSLVVFLSGGLSATFAVLLTYPFDNIRVRLQTNDLAGKHNMNMRSMMYKVYSEEGLSGFYIGYLPRLMKKGFSCALAWMFYEKIRKDKVIH